MILTGARAGAVMEPLSVYRVRATSLSADRAAMLEGKIGTLEKAVASGLLASRDLAVVGRSLERYRRERDVEVLRATLASGSDRVRRRAARIAVARDVQLRDRLEAAAAVATPGLVGRAHRRRAQRFWVGAGGVKVEREQTAQAGSGRSPERTP
jgi:hypothetical protein